MFDIKYMDVGWVNIWNTKKAQKIKFGQNTPNYSLPRPRPTRKPSEESLPAARDQKEKQGMAGGAAGDSARSWEKR